MGKPQFRRAMSQAKEKGLVEQLLQHFVLTDKAKKEIKLNLVVGSKKAEQSMAHDEGEQEEEEEEAAAPQRKKSSTPRKRAAATKAAATRGSGKGRGTRGTKRVASSKSSGRQAKKAKTITA